MEIITPDALAHVNHGRWIADCPLGCGNAMSLEPNQGMFHCPPPGGCGHIGPVKWPSDAQEIWDALQGRFPKNMNWYPAGHPIAERGGVPTGQTPQELIDEAEEMTRG